MEWYPDGWGIEHLTVLIKKGSIVKWIVIQGHTELKLVFKVGEYFLEDIFTLRPFYGILKLHYLF